MQTDQVKSVETDNIHKMKENIEKKIALKSRIVVRTILFKKRTHINVDDINSALHLSEKPFFGKNLYFFEYKFGISNAV